MSGMHAKYHYSITCHTHDKAVMFCLRSLAHFAEHSSQKNIAWSGTTDKAWEEAGHRITLRFTSPKYRDVFRREAKRILGDKWSEAGASDTDPATPKG